MITKIIFSIISSFFKLKKVPVYPMTINYETNSKCNLNCVMCNRGNYFKEDYWVDFEKFKAWYDQTRPYFVALHGYGEPLLNKELGKMIRYAKAHGSKTTITSNFILLGDRAEELITSGLDLLKVSLDAVDPATYVSIRRVDQFNLVVDNLKKIVAKRDELKKRNPEIRINFTISKNNFHQIKDIIKLAASIGLDSVCFATLLFKDSLLENREGIGDIDKEEFLKEIHEGIKVSEEIGCSTNLGNIIHDFSYLWYSYDKKDPEAQKNTRRCLKPWISSFISSSGDVKPCDLLGLTDETMGNINEKSFEEIWNSPKYQEFREAIRDGKRPNAVCADCFPLSYRDFFEYRKISKKYLTED